MLWVIYGLLHSLFRAAFAETGRIFHVDGWKLSFWHSLFAAGILLPVLPFAHWPMDGRFYFAAVIVGLIMAVGTLIQLNLTSRKSGRVSSIYMPLEAICALLIWIAVMPAAFDHYSENMIMTAFVIAAFIIGTLAMCKVRPQDISLSTFSVVAPVGITYAVAGVVTKLVMPETDIFLTAVTFAFVNYAITAFAIGLVLGVKKKPLGKLSDGKLMNAGVVAGGFSVIAYTTFVASVALAPNPGYVSLLAMLLPVWMILFHKMVGEKDKSNRMAAFFIAVAALLLVFAYMMT